MKDYILLVLPFILLFTLWVMEEIWSTPRRGTYGPAPGMLPLNCAIGMFLAKGRYVPTGRSNDEHR